MECPFYIIELSSRIVKMNDENYELKQSCWFLLLNGGMHKIGYIFHDTGQLIISSDAFIEVKDDCIVLYLF